ncbi:MAG TPA: endonuclease III [Patescibacteria group bacterium]|nr:endonuclease III [Patescibacteria group bacterium]
MMKADLARVIRLMEKQAREFRVPYVTDVAGRNDPYLVLISCILSLRTQDKATTEASRRLFRAASTPVKMLTLSSQRIAKLIYPVGFYRTKARHIRHISRRIIAAFRGQVPDTLEGLLSLKGVGLKTANLVLGLGYGKPAICVDTHVHRISNRLGWVKTRAPEETEQALRQIVPKRHWIALNTIMVTFGQNVCTPISPRCSLCSVRRLCKRKGVTTWR